MLEGGAGFRWIGVAHFFPPIHRRRVARACGARGIQRIRREALRNLSMRHLTTELAGLMVCRTSGLAQKRAPSHEAKYARCTFPTTETQPRPSKPRTRVWRM